jgi:hypothetical protein
MGCVPLMGLRGKQEAIPCILRYGCAGQTTTQHNVSCHLRS